jgi:hypothetical protein
MEIRDISFRAEFMGDVDRFLEAISAEGLIVVEKVEDPVMFEVEVRMEIKSTVPKLIIVANSLDDCHVIAQTINYTNLYNGERDYDR